MSFGSGAYRNARSSITWNWVARNGPALTNGISEMTADGHNGCDKRARVMVTVQDGV